MQAEVPPREVAQVVCVAGAACAVAEWVAQAAWAAVSGSICGPDDISRILDNTRIVEVCKELTSNGKACYNYGNSRMRQSTNKMPFTSVFF